MGRAKKENEEIKEELKTKKDKKENKEIKEETNNTEDANKKVQDILKKAKEKGQITYAR